MSELPEGWREDPDWFDWRRRDGRVMVDYLEPMRCCDEGKTGFTAWRSDGPHCWVAAFKDQSDFPTALEAMQALDREYPLGEVEHGAE